MYIWADSGLGLVHTQALYWHGAGSAAGAGCPGAALCGDVGAGAWTDSLTCVKNKYYDLPV